MRIYETFSSLQGESTHAGRLCFFIRLAGCNLSCPYCDTKKALSFSSGAEMTVRDALSLAVESGVELVEVTGGEPLASPETPELCRLLLDAGKQVLVETNGSFDVSVLPDGAVRILDFKTPSSGMEKRMYEPNYRSLRPVDEVKFVVSDVCDYEFALETVNRFRMYEQTENILLSPAFGVMDLKVLAERMIRDRFPGRLNLQFHKMIWGVDAEGV